MSVDASLSLFPTRVSRWTVSLACQVGVENLEYEGTVINVSFTGLGIELKADVSEIDLTVPVVVIVDGLGKFVARIRWNRGSRVGLKFSDTEYSKIRVQEYLNKNEMAYTCVPQIERPN